MTEQEIIEKKNEIETELNEQKKISEERLSQIRYLHADFDNLKKHFEKERMHIIKLANESLIKELIVVVDDMESSLRMINDEKEREGIQKIHSKMLAILKKHGLNGIEALGKKIDPLKHEAIIKEKSDREDGEVIEELQKGYLLNSKVIRPSKVKISEKFKNDSEKINNEEKQNG